WPPGRTTPARFPGQASHRFVAVSQPWILRYRAGGSTSTGFVAAIVSLFAVTMVLPSPIAVRRPDWLTVAMATSDDDHATAAVLSWTRPSDIVARAVSWEVSPPKLRLALPSIDKATTVTAGVGAT